MRKLLRARGALAIFAVVVTVASGCGGVDSLSFGKPPAVKSGVGNNGQSLPGNLNRIAQAHVAGVTTTTVPTIGPGNASIIGTVFGPNGPVGGATVEADRLVGNQVATTTVTTAADGSFVVASVLGGRYRVRAWESPTLALTDPQIFFLGATESHQLQLHLGVFTGPDVSTSFNPSVLNVGDTANLAVEVGNPAVGPDGIVRDKPLSGIQVTLTNGPAWSVANGNPQTTGSDGRALFEISCSSAGSNPLSVQIGSSTPEPINVPDCVVPPPPTSQCSPPSSGGGGVPGNTTSTTQPNGGC